MSSTLDVDVLLYASDTSSPFHVRAGEFLEERARGPDLLYLFWPTLMAYLRIATHPGIFHEPLTPGIAEENVGRLIALPHVRTPGEEDGFWATRQQATEDLVVRGNLVPDSHVVALMRQHGVAVIWTRDRDFRKFSGIRVADPFV